MMNPYDKAHELARAIRELDAYKKLVDARSVIEKDASALQMVQDFRLKQFEYQARQMSGQEIPSSEMEKLNKLAEVIALNREVSTYLQAEYQFTVVLSDLQKILTEAAEEAILPVPGMGDGSSGQS